MILAYQFGLEEEVGGEAVNDEQGVGFSERGDGFAETQKGKKWV